MCATAKSDKHGIALVVVLGFLSVLVLMAVTFAIVMRTERLASRNYNDQVRARHLVHAALARIIADHVRTAMGTNVYPPWEAIYSQYDGRPGPDFVSYPDSDGWPYVPISLFNAAMNANRAEWRPMRDPDPQDNRFLGEYAYLVVNNSGLLDANFIGSLTTNRVDGYDPGEIRYSYVLTEFNTDTLHNYRTNFVRFESVPELYYLASSESDEVRMTGIRRALRWLSENPRSYADHLHVYSRFPQGYAVWDPTVRAWVANTNVAYIGGTATTWNISALQTALADLSPDPIPDLTAFINVLYDYADKDPWPRGNNDAERFERISSKSVPMINEVIISNTFRLVTVSTNQELQHRLYITVETWYPFPPNPDDPSPSYTVEHQGTPIARVQGYFPTSLLEPETPANLISHTVYDFRTSTVVYVQKRLVNGVNQPPFPPPVGTLLCDVRLTGKLRVMRGGKPVDVVNPTWPDQAFFQDAAQVPAITLDGPPGPFGTPVAFSVNDPRINWNPGEASQWVKIAPTLGDMNLRDPNWPEAPADEFGHMYCRRGPLRSIGEVGYLLYDASKPWRTIRLMTNSTLNPPDPHTARILDRVRVQPPEFQVTTNTRNQIIVVTNWARQGLVNINTRQTNATAAMFYHMPIEPYPGYPDRYGLTKDNALKLASRVLQINTARGPQVNYSDTGLRWEQTDMAAFVDSGWQSDAVATNKFWAESFVRNSIGLWGTRHNLFTVFLATRVFSDAYNPTLHSAVASNYVVGEQRAVAVLWRDPFQTKDQYGVSSHENFVRFFHWLVLLFED